jgi:hypothetical protein
MPSALAVLMLMINPVNSSIRDFAVFASLQYFVHSSIGNSTNTNQPGPATRA